MIVFKYKEESLGRKEGSIKRPVADAFLKTNSGLWIEFHPYIDSGADVTLIPLSLGKLIGWRLNQEKIEQIGGIRGSVPVIYKKTDITIGKKRFPLNLGWALIEEIPPLLGRTDVFDRFDITFKQNKDIIIFQDRI